jgi:hypothetical protein
MKRLLLIIILIFNFQSLTKADDIRDFQIEGMSIGDSLLDYFSEEEIKNFEKSYYPKSKKYYRIENNYNFNKTLKIYDGLAFEIKENDTKYKLESINGILSYQYDIEKCYPKKEEIVKEISSSFNKFKSKSYIFNYPNYNGKSEVTDFIYSNGSVRVWCSDYSKKGEKIFYDFLGVLVSNKEHDDWIKNEAY